MRPPLTATAAYRRLRRRLGRRGAACADSVPPLAVRREAAARYPPPPRPRRRVIDFYLRESFGGQALEDEELEVLKAALGRGGEEDAEGGLTTVPEGRTMNLLWLYRAPRSGSAC